MTLAHRKPDGATFTGEDFTKRITDERMQFGSLGALQDKGKLELAFQFPGSEGDRTYICCGGGWANRSHPLRKGFSHSYELRFTATSPPSSHNDSSYAAAVQSAWREAFAEVQS